MLRRNHLPYRSSNNATQRLYLSHRVTATYSCFILIATCRLSNFFYLSAYVSSNPNSNSLRGFWQFFFLAKLSSLQLSNSQSSQPPPRTLRFFHLLLESCSWPDRSAILAQRRPLSLSAYHSTQSLSAETSSSTAPLHGISSTIHCSSTRICQPLSTW